MREVQELAIPAIVPGDKDVLIGAATAAGKTEAAFFPVLTHMLQQQEGIGLTLYISPLKALINDQFGRLEKLCGDLDIPVWPWHGDVAASTKSRFYRNASGILLITPESLEAMLCNKGSLMQAAFAGLRYVVIDELHAFIGTERGMQLQSLMHRIDSVVGRKIPRIGLSATLGDMGMAAEFLRPHAGRAVQILEAGKSGTVLKVQIKAYVQKAPATGDWNSTLFDVEQSLGEHIFKTTLGSNNLVFTNSRARVETYTHLLQGFCKSQSITNEYWPHHGSLSKQLREETEAALKSKIYRTTAVCTSTLELGIDIGPVISVAQVGSPPSVASLRQRMGRSGRREGEATILRGYVIEPELEPDCHFRTPLREDLVEMTAMVSLLLEGWFEPPVPSGMHLSTFVQQLLSSIAQRSGITAADAYNLLCLTGPFQVLTKTDYILLLRHLGSIEVIEQDSSGLLLVGKKGEPFVNHYTFFAAFKTEDEFRIVHGSQPLGSVPVESGIGVGDLILFGARTWKIEDINLDSKTIYVKQQRGGKAPRFSTSGTGHLHTKVRERMRELYLSNETPAYLDPVAARLLTAARVAFTEGHLEHQTVIASESGCSIFTWMGDDANAALAAMLKSKQWEVLNNGFSIEVAGSAGVETRVINCLKDLASAPLPVAETLLEGIKNLDQEKWDWALPPSLLTRSYASLNLDIAQAHAWLVANWA